MREIHTQDTGHNSLRPYLPASYQTLTVVALVRDATSEELVTALIERASQLLARPLALEFYSQNQQSLLLEEYLADLSQDDDVERVLLLPWYTHLNSECLVEAAKNALATHQDIKQWNQEPRRHYAQELSSLESWIGVRNPQEALDRFIAFYPGWHRQTTCLSVGTKHLLLPCTEHSMSIVPVLEEWQMLAMVQSIVAVLLNDLSVVAPLRYKGEIMVRYLSCLICDLVESLMEIKDISKETEPLDVIP